MCCLLVLDSVTSTPQWIRQPKPRGGVHFISSGRVIRGHGGGGVNDVDAGRDRATPASARHDDNSRKRRKKKPQLHRVELGRSRRGSRIVKVTKLP